MGKIIISENVSVDGVIQDPTGLDRSGRGSWFTTIGDKDRELWAAPSSRRPRGPRPC